MATGGDINEHQKSVTAELQGIMHTLTRASVNPGRGDFTRQIVTFIIPAGAQQHQKHLFLVTGISCVVYWPKRSVAKRQNAEDSL